MFNNKQGQENIPVWFKFLLNIIFLTIIGVSGLALVMPARPYYGLAHESIISILLIAALLFGVATTLVTFFSKKNLSRGIYWLFYKLRWFIFFFGLYGALEYALRLPLFYFVYIEPKLNIVSLFSIRGLVPLVGLGGVFISVLIARPIVNPFAQSHQKIFLPILEQVQLKITVLNPRWIAIIPAILPPLIVLTVIYFIWGAKLSDYLPIFWNDATGYWLWIRQFSHYGFNSGYNYANELMPPATFNHFGEGSPVYTYFYGIFGLLFGWSAQLPILINFGLIFGSIYAFSRVLKLDNIQNFVLAAVISVSWPVLIFSATTSHESLNQAIAIGFAGILLFAMKEKQFGPLKISIVLLFMFFAGMIRLSWIILFFPLLFYFFRGNVLQRFVGSIIAGSTLAIGIILLTRYLVPPINNSIFATLNGEISEIFYAVLTRFQIEFMGMVIPAKLGSGLATIFIIGILFCYSIANIFRKIQTKNSLDAILKSQSFFDTYNITVLVLAGMALYLEDGFYRVFFPPLMVSIFMQIAQRKYHFVPAFLVFSLLFAPVITQNKSDLTDIQMNYTYEMPGLEESRPVLDKIIKYDKTTNDPWCNTVLIPLDFYDGRLTALDPGIGISYILYYPLQDGPIKSNYLLIERDDYNDLLEKNNLRAVQLAALPIGNLYKNLDSSCTH